MNSYTPIKLDTPIYRMSSDKHIPGIEDIGGKGHNLARVASQGFNIPDFFVVKTSLFERFMGESLSQLDDFFQLSKISANHLDTTSQQCIALIQSIDFSETHKKDIANAVNGIVDLSDEQFAVRSSAVDEDSNQHSFAGQMDSYLYVKPGDQLLDAIKSCFCSAFSHRSLCYRLENNISMACIRPAVVVQRMISGDVSGVLFTGNPLNNNPEESVINATYGLGEGVVSGLTQSDLWVIDDNYVVLTTKIENKNEKIVLDNQLGSGTCIEAVNEYQAKKPALTKIQIKELVRLGEKIEHYYDGIPQDIEWAIRNNRFYILQSRPVSTLSHISKKLPRTILDNSNIVESFSGITSPLTFSFASRVYEKVYQQYFGIMGIPSARIAKLSTTFRTMLTYFNGNIYYNLNSWYKSLSLLPFYQTNRDNLDLSIGVQTQSNVSKVQSNSKLKQWVYDLPIAAHSILRILFFYSMKKRIKKTFLENFNKTVKPYLNQDYEDWTNHDIAKAYNSIEQVLLQEWKCPIINDFFTESFYGLLTHFLKKAIQDDDIQSLQNDLLCYQGSVESLRPTTELLKIADEIRKEEALQYYLLNNNEHTLVTEILGDHSIYPRLQSSIKSYIQEFGYRCVNELKLEEKTIRDDPSTLFKMIKNYLRGNNTTALHTTVNKDNIRAQAEEKLNQCLENTPVKKWIALWLASNTREHVRIREELRFCRTKVFGIVRNMMNAFAHNFVKKNMLTQTSDIYYLTLSEILEVIETRSTNTGMLQILVNERRKKSIEHQTMPAPIRLHLYGDQEDRNYVEVYSSSDSSDVEIDPNADSYVGTACCPGNIQGTVKVLTEFEDIELNGEILVAKRTDPGWVTLFPCITGLIVERGSVLSHSAVVAREMGIPTVVGLRGITDRLKDGDRVEIDGASGSIKIL